VVCGDVAVKERELEAASNTPPPAQAQNRPEISNASLLRNPSKVIVLRVSCLCSHFIRLLKLFYTTATAAT